MTAIGLNYEVFFTELQSRFDLVRDSRKNLHRTLVSGFLSDLQKRSDLMRHNRENLNRTLASGFNLIDFLRPDEYRLSEMIALLLNPQGGHGQGTVFLQRFLQQLNDVKAATALSEEVVNGKSVYVALEQRTRHGRRIDIVLSAGRVGIGIENKPWALDQEGQLDDYAYDLEKRFHKWALVYVRGYGGLPSERVLPKARRTLLLEQHTYAEWRYWSDLTKWLKDCLEVCEAEKVRWLLRDFLAYVQSNFDSAEAKE
jgi:PD-(D/E)XK nuclease superfamily